MSAKPPSLRIGSKTAGGTDLVQLPRHRHAGGCVEQPSLADKLPDKHGCSENVGQSEQSKCLVAAGRHIWPAWQVQGTSMKQEPAARACKSIVTSVHQLFQPVAARVHVPLALGFRSCGTFPVQWCSACSAIPKLTLLSFFLSISSSKSILSTTSAVFLLDFPSRCVLLFSCFCSAGPGLLLCSILLIFLLPLHSLASIGHTCFCDLAKASRDLNSHNTYIICCRFGCMVGSQMPRFGLGWREFGTANVLLAAVWRGERRHALSLLA